jgi:hypothetical protein
LKRKVPCSPNLDKDAAVVNSMVENNVEAVENRVGGKIGHDLCVWGPKVLATVCFWSEAFVAAKLPNMEGRAFCEWDCGRPLWFAWL